MAQAPRDDSTSNVFSLRKRQLELIVHNLETGLNLISSVPGHENERATILRVIAEIKNDFNEHTNGTATGDHV